jgi:hypothetical protein
VTYHARRLIYRAHGPDIYLTAAQATHIETGGLGHFCAECSAPHVDHDGDR